MDILLAFVFGAALGVIAHAILPGRELRGAALAPIVGALVGGAVWLALTWAGLTTDDVVLWAAALLVPAVVVVVGVVALTRIRRSHDAREAARLGIA
ncbi:hypothetical protein LQ938_09955 [Microbacterium sp. cx-55]|uniref:hypothetical protein n=1 Tax=unclassified Microbacterium TaxID=2609290 RepID=UPI001CBAB28B|nr:MULTISPECIES: hypothetical protein [unclassified Microbacterium]MBZ4485916.1 hypothetical protein [Microbacterium sp. cx-55]MCC4906877.1 hypothetical protein [Microbacterium sp. cx-59]UGB34208.1 hypothetical protein LQ938_09955 [Microbacterium sp. cx-55]